MKVSLKLLQKSPSDDIAGKGPFQQLTQDIRKSDLRYSFSSAHFQVEQVCILEAEIIHQSVVHYQELILLDPGLYLSDHSESEKQLHLPDKKYRYIQEPDREISESPGILGQSAF